MVTVPPDLRQRLKTYGQEHVLAWWDRLNDSERQDLLDQLQALDLDELRKLYQQREKTFTLPAAERIRPIPVSRLGADEREVRQRGEEVVRRGEVAVLL